MRTILGLSLLFYSALGLAALPGKLDVYALLLASAKPDDIKMGARSIQQDGIKDPALLDLVADRLCMYVRAGDDDDGQRMDDSDNVDTVSWLAKALGGSGDAKYRSILEEALKKTDRDKNKKYIGTSLAQLPAAPATPAAAPACLNAADFRALALAGRIPVKLTPEADTSFKEGVPLDEVLQKLGVPTTARYYQYTTFHPFVGHLNFDDIEISYLNGVTIQFDYDDGWKVIKAIPNMQDPAADPTAPDAALLDAVLSGDKETVSNAADDMKDAKNFPVEVLDAAARRVWRVRGTDGDDALDAAEDLCDLLGESHNARYRTILGQVAQQAKEKKMRKYATEALDSIKGGDAEQLPVPAT